jgi:hypothetical protein
VDGAVPLAAAPEILSLYEGVRACLLVPPDCSLQKYIFYPIRCTSRDGERRRIGLGFLTPKQEDVQPLCWES